MQVFNIDTELRRHTTSKAIAREKWLIGHPIIERPPYSFARAYANAGLPDSTAASLLAEENVPDQLKFSLFIQALTGSAKSDFEWGMNHKWLLPDMASQSISQSLKTEQEIALLQLKMVTSSLGLSD